MSTLSSTRYQYRSFESTYLFKVKSEDEISLKILDLSQKCLFKRVFSIQEFSLLDTRQLLANGNFVSVLERLVEKQLLPRQHVAASSKATLEKSSEEALDQAIVQFKPRVCAEAKELEKFTCPLTLEIFQDPVMDEHGHTFEKSAIEESLKIKKECPISREPIDSLVPNRLVKQTIEEWRQKDPIPSFSLFQKENPKLAGSNLQMAQTCIEEGEYKEALEFYAKAFQYTRKPEDYATLPSLFERMGEYEKATLAYLYLAKYQFLAGNLLGAIETLETCQKGKTAFLQNNLVLAELYSQNGQSQKASALLRQTAEISSKKSPEQAIALYRRILRDHPEEFPLYFHLATLLEIPQEKSQTLLKGALEAMQKGNHPAAEKLIREAESLSEDSFIDSLVSLDFLQRHGDAKSLRQKLLYLAKIFEQKTLTKQTLAVYKMLFQLEKSPKFCEQIVNAYQMLQKPQKEFAWSLTLVALRIEKQEWQQAEVLAKKVLEKASSEQRIFLYEKLEEVYTKWHGHELQDLWPKLGKAYQENKQLALAEKTYRKAFERFCCFEDILTLAEILQESGKTQESVHTYYEAAATALLEQNSNKLSLCTKEIKRIDPNLQYLDLNQKMLLLTQESLLKLQSQNKKLSLELSQAHEEVAAARAEIALLT